MLLLQTSQGNSIPPSPPVLLNESQLLSLKRFKEVIETTGIQICSDKNKQTNKKIMELSYTVLFYILLILSCIRSHLQGLSVLQIAPNPQRGQLLSCGVNLLQGSVSSVRALTDEKWKCQ